MHLPLMALLIADGSDLSASIWVIRGKVFA
jgi:hypothetical protein